MINPHLAFAKQFPEPLQQLARSLSEKLEEGHICIDLNAEAELAEIVKQDPQLLELDNMQQPYSPQPFVRYRNRIYFHRYFRYENIILDKIRAMVEASADFRNNRKTALLNMKESLAALFDRRAEGPDMQLCAAISAYLSNFCIITGGPGTGKTSTVAKLLSLLFREKPEMRVAVAAPTGKAAARLNEVFSQYANPADEAEITAKINAIEAGTIHRLLGAYKKFRHNADNQLEVDLVIVDECSMIDASLMAKLMSAIPNNSRLILLGDRNQLSSVEAGSIFADLCVAGLETGNFFTEDFATFVRHFGLEGLKRKAEKNLLSDLVTELNYSHRFLADGDIGKFSRLTISGDESSLSMEDYAAFPKKEQKVELVSGFIADSDENFKQLIAQLKAYYAEPDIEASFKKLNQFRILCALRAGKSGADYLNSLLEHALGIKSRKREFYHKQAVLITKNDYQNEIYNGDIGIIIDKNYKEKDDAGKPLPEKLAAYFLINGKLKEIALMNISDYETAFAMTIHKSQGSEYDHVYIFLPSGADHPLLSRELLYTAVTRAKSKAVIYATEELIRNSIAKRIRRISGISDRLLNENSESI
jgi:exodeoxyribonuclease V alpha subunit